MNAKIYLEAIGHRVAKETTECVGLFRSWADACEHRAMPTDTEVGGCKHEKAYAKHLNLKLAWCDYYVCPVIAAGMESYKNG